eukprot:1804805-Rhodomonas_salina.2
MEGKCHVTHRTSNASVDFDPVRFKIEGTTKYKKGKKKEKKVIHAGACKTVLYLVRRCMGYCATEYLVLRSGMALPGSRDKRHWHTVDSSTGSVAYGPTRTVILTAVLKWALSVLTWAIRVRSSYAVSGTDLAYALRCPVLTLSIVLRACYAISGTDLAYRATDSTTQASRDLTSWCLTEVRYQPTHALCHVRYGPDVWHYRPTRCPVLT